MLDDVVPDDDISSSSDESALEQIRSSAHEARTKYEQQIGLYRDFANDVGRLITVCLEGENVGVHSVTAREKDPEHFELKAAQSSPDDPTQPKYADPLNDITDKAAVRVTTYFLDTVTEVSKIIERQFEVVERTDKSSGDPDRVGYQSIHYLVRHLPTRAQLPEYHKFSGLIAEVQVRTILQHAWAEIEHDIQYKAIAAVPERIRRRFASLAGLIEIADREFQAIANEDNEIRAQARHNIGIGHLDQVEITTSSFKEYIDAKYGTDKRMRDFSYDWAVRLLKDLGFTNLAEVDECISNYNDDTVSRAVWPVRQGQLTRFEYVLMASMGPYFLMAHPWTRDYLHSYYSDIFLGYQYKIHLAGIALGEYRPNNFPDTRMTVSDVAELRADYEAAAEKRNRAPREALEANGSDRPSITE